MHISNYTNDFKMILFFQTHTSDLTQMLCTFLSDFNINITSQGNIKKDLKIARAMWLQTKSTNKTIIIIVLIII